MRSEDLKKALKEAIKYDIAVMIKGSPGLGKSAIVHQVAEELGYDIIDYRLSQVDSVDLRGVPSIKDGRTVWNPPDEFPKDPKSKGILFLDEINSASQSVQAAAYQLVLDRALGTYELPPGWIPIAAGNRTTDRAIVNQMPTPLRNRFAHFELEPSIDDWSNWAVGAGVSEETIAFLRFRSNLLDMFSGDKKEQALIKDTDTIYTPRSWVMASNFVRSPLRLSLMTACVGAGPAAEFEAYLRVYQELPDLDALMKDPKIWRDIKNPGAMYAVATGIAARVKQGNKALVKAFFQIVDKIPVEYGALAVKDAERRNPQILDELEFISWTHKHVNVLMKS